MELFTPQLILSEERDGSFTLHALTLAPNNSFSAGPAEVESPPDVVILPEAIAVMLHIQHRGGIHLPVVTPVQHCVQNLALGDSLGKTSVIAFAVLDGKIVGEASISLQERGRMYQMCHERGEDPIATSDWSTRTSASGTLLVSGTVTVPNPGYDVALRFASPQGINPRELILDLKLTRRDGIWPQVVTRVPVSYRQAGASGLYDSVLIRLAGGGSVQLDVKQKGDAKQAA